MVIVQVFKDTELLRLIDLYSGHFLVVAGHLVVTLGGTIWSLLQSPGTELFTLVDSCLGRLSWNDRTHGCDTGEKLHSHC